jgi:alpha-tubulin suppressor-like RCC1 family protein
LATKGASVTLASGCTSVSLSLGGTPPDLAGSDGGGGGMVRHAGERCSPGDVCVGSSCVDGYCCSTACTDTCAACDVTGHEGTCTAASGTPHGSRACNGMASGECAGSCNGIDIGSCVYPTVACGVAPSCAAGVGTPAGMCTMGTCNQSMMSCADKLCGASACQSVAQVAVGSDFACALISDGTVRCWGHNNRGQLAQGGTDVGDRLVPTPVPGLTGVSYIAAGDQHACAIVSGGTLVCWGANYSHQLGLGEATNTNDQTPHTTPTPVCASGTGASCPPLTNVTKVAAGPEDTCAIVGQGVQCWGGNPLGNLGDGSPNLPATANPQTVCSGPTTCTNPLGYVNGGITEIAMGYYHVCALDRSGNTYCWGNNGAGECGAPGNNPAQFNYPQYISTVNMGNQKAIKLAATAYGACAIISDGNTANNLVRCWGYGGSGERGNSTSGGSAYGPAAVTTCSAVGCGSNLTGATAIAGTDSTMCAVANGAVWCWGNNSAGTVGVGSVATTTYTVATPSLVTTGAIDLAGSEGDTSTMCARLNAGGTLRCWGLNSSGQIGDGTKTTPQPTPTAQTW